MGVTTPLLPLSGLRQATLCPDGTDSNAWDAATRAFSRSAASRRSPIAPPSRPPRMAPAAMPVPLPPSAAPRRPPAAAPPKPPTVVLGPMPSQPRSRNATRITNTSVSRHACLSIAILPSCYYVTPCFYVHRPWLRSYGISCRDAPLATAHPLRRSAFSVRKSALDLQ